MSEDRQPRVPMTRVRIALATVIAAALMPAVGIFMQVAGTPQVLRRQNDPISTFERRVAPLREVLRNEPAVGYRLMVDP